MCPAQEGHRAAGTSPTKVIRGLSPSALDQAEGAGAAGEEKALGGSGESWEPLAGPEGALRAERGFGQGHGVTGQGAMTSG